MKAAVVKAFGPPDVLRTENVHDPVPGPADAVIAVEYADVLWAETLIRSGAGGEHFDATPPYVPGGAVAGRVRAVGAAVDPEWNGQRVVARTGQQGGYAEHVRVSAENLVRVPEGLGLRTAAALLHDGPTALALIEGNRVGRGDRVLVVGASGGLGIASAQLSAALGAHVVALARNETKLKRLRELDIGTVIDIEATDWLDQARSAIGGRGAQVVLDNVGGMLGLRSFSLIAPGGRFSAHGTPSGNFTAIDPTDARARDVTIRDIRDVQLSDREVRRLTELALAEAVAGRLDPVVGQTYPLNQAAQAHADIESRTVFGKTLLTV